MSEATGTVCVQATFFEWPDVQECSETVHYFDKVPGRCRCKREVWEPDPPRLRIGK